MAWAGDNKKGDRSVSNEIIKIRRNETKRRAENRRERSEQKI